jgi:tRNA1(Val) A37 N6-methylase TrmN6
MIARETQLQRKARGAFYTPPELASYVVQWAITSDTTRVLEPSAGDGVFLEASAKRIKNLGANTELVGVELIEEEARVALARAIDAGLTPRMEFGDFFGFDRQTLGTFGAVVGNPPWIRFHGFTGDQRSRARLRAAEAGVEISGLASSWAPYVVHAAALLDQAGRLGMVLPAELLQVDYADPIRRFLSRRFRSVRIVAFDGPQFRDAQVDAILLLASDDGPPGVSFSRVSSIGDIADSQLWPMPSDGRWASSIGSTVALDLLDDLEASGRMVRLGSLGEVDIGVVTGFNDYFVVSDPEVDVFDLPSDTLRPIVTRSDQLVDRVVDEAHFTEWRAQRRKVWLVALGHDAPPTATRYLDEGRRRGVPNRYKCRTRPRWFAVPQKAPPDLFLSYMAQHGPRVARNELGAMSTNLIHGVYLADPTQAAWIATTWDNPATSLSAELEGRSYGGGVLKLETKEAERVLVPTPAPEFALSNAERDVLNDALAERRRTRLGRTGRASGRDFRRVARSSAN